MSPGCGRCGPQGSLSAMTAIWTRPRCCPGETMWKSTRCMSGVGRSRRSPGIPGSTGFDTFRAYLAGQRQPGQRAKPAQSLIDPVVEYCRLRLGEDPHLWAQPLFDEIVELGFTGFYPTLTAAIRQLRLRPHCEACTAVKGRDAGIIDHPADEETQWDWVCAAARPGARSALLSGQAVGQWVGNPANYRDESRANYRCGLHGVSAKIRTHHVRTREVLSLRLWQRCLSRTGAMLYCPGSDVSAAQILR